MFTTQWFQKCGEKYHMMLDVRPAYGMEELSSKIHHLGTPICSDILWRCNSAFSSTPQRTDMSLICVPYTPKHIILWEFWYRSDICFWKWPMMFERFTITYKVDWFLETHYDTWGHSALLSTSFTRTQFIWFHTRLILRINKYCRSHWLDVSLFDTHLQLIFLKITLVH